MPAASRHVPHGSTPRASYVRPHTYALTTSATHSCQESMNCTCVLTLPSTITSLGMPAHFNRPKLSSYLPRGLGPVYLCPTGRYTGCSTTTRSMSRLREPGVGSSCDVASWLARRFHAVVSQCLDAPYPSIGWHCRADASNKAAAMLEFLFAADLYASKQTPRKHCPALRGRVVSFATRALTGVIGGVQLFGIKPVICAEPTRSSSVQCCHPVRTVSTR